MTTRKRSTPPPPRFEREPEVIAPKPEAPPPPPVAGKELECVLNIGDLVYREPYGWFKVVRASDCSATLDALFTVTKVIHDHLHDTRTEVFTSGRSLIICRRPYLLPGHYIKGGKIRRRTT